MSGTDDGASGDAPRRGDPAQSGVDTKSRTGGLQPSLPDWPRVWAACVRRTHAWQTPPRWSRRDWWEEIDAEGIATACHALHIFDPSRGPSLGCFVYHQVISRALARYRQEWSYARRCGVLSADEALSPRAEDGVVADHEAERLRRSMAGLPEADRRLIEQLFWEDRTETQVAGRLGISQQAVNKRKRKVLLELRRSLEQTAGP
jgi:RNA polymerase sigma factor (sigma-70 family)